MTGISFGDVECCFPVVCQQSVKLDRLRSLCRKTRAEKKIRSKNRMIYCRFIIEHQSGQRKISEKSYPQYSEKEDMLNIIPQGLIHSNKAKFNKLNVKFTYNLNRYLRILVYSSQSVKKLTRLLTSKCRSYFFFTNFKLAISFIYHFLANMICWLCLFWVISESIYAVRKV